MSKFYQMLIFVALSFAVGCSALTHKVAVYTENGLYAGAQGWSEDVVDPAVEACRDEYQDGLDDGLTEDELRSAWEACIAPTRRANAELKKYASDAVAGLRAYWIAASANDRAGMLQALREIKEAVSHLPDSHFRGLKKILARY